MENENCEKTYVELIDEKIDFGRKLAVKLERDFIAVDGALKTKRNIEKEIKFLQKVCSERIFFRSRLNDFVMIFINFPVFSSNRNRSSIAMKLTSTGNCSAQIWTSSVI